MAQSNAPVPRGLPSPLADLVNSTQLQIRHASRRMPPDFKFHIPLTRTCLSSSALLRTSLPLCPFFAAVYLIRPFFCDTQLALPTSLCDRGHLVCSCCNIKAPERHCVWRVQVARQDRLLQACGSAAACASAAIPCSRCLRYACMKGWRSPSITPATSDVSCRRGSMIGCSST